MVQADVAIIDFHSHYFDPAWRSSPLPATGSIARVWPLITDIQQQLADLAAAGIDAKVMSAPTANLAAPRERLAPGFIQSMNDHFAELVAAHPGQLLALGTIDAFQGEAAGREVERVVNELGFGGIVVDCAQGDQFLDAPEAQPTLEAAAALRAVVFVHPVSPAGLTERLAALGPTGVLIARGTENAASILALLRSGVFDALPELKAVIPAIGAPVLIFAAQADREFGHEAGWRGSRPSETRKRLYLDTMGLDPALIRFAVALLGIEQVVFGTDWPIMPIAERSQVMQALIAAGITDASDRAAILSGNTLRLLNQLRVSRAMEQVS
jgi:predicted TIM-barrel fold metal-dependent hydrolase